MSFLVFSLPLLFSIDVETIMKLILFSYFTIHGMKAVTMCSKGSTAAQLLARVRLSQVFTSLFWRISSLVRFSCNFILRKGEVIWYQTIWRIRESFLWKPYLCRICHKANFGQDDVSQISIRWNKISQTKLHVIE